MSREVLPETPFLFSIMAAHAQAERFLQFQASWLVLVCVKPCNFFLIFLAAFLIFEI
jgi:hypothetical protein